MKDGILIIDKPSGWTSNDVVQKVKRLIGASKVGHTGTLDPLATGVLALCVGSATKMSDQFLNLDKEYEVSFKLGEETDTGDSDGRVISRLSFPRKRESPEIPAFAGMTVLMQESLIEESLNPFRGEIDQKVPAYSAVKWKGRPLYKWARKGEEVPRPVRRIKIFKFDAISCELPVVSFRVVCSKGTYVRTLLSDWASSLGLVGHVIALRRTRSGPFKIADAVTIEDLQRTLQAEICMLGCAAYVRDR